MIIMSFLKFLKIFLRLFKGFLGDLLAIIRNLLLILALLKGLS
jgi:hypothetical protein